MAEMSAIFHDIHVWFVARNPGVLVPMVLPDPPIKSATPTPPEKKRANGITLMQRIIIHMNGKLTYSQKH